MLTLSEASTARRDGGGYVLDVPEGWKQGRGAYGGLVIGALVRAIDDAVGDPARAVRSVTAELPAPVEVGPAAIAVEVLRAGASLSAVRAELRQGGEVRAHAVAILAAERPGTPTWQHLVAPVAPAWREVTPTPLERGFPEFARHFEFRLVEGVPFTRGAPRTVGWIRAQRPGPRRDAAYVAALADVWWPAAMVVFGAPRPLATISYTLEIVGTLDGLDPDAPLLYRAHVPVSAGGYFVEERELWGEDGRLIARNHQTFAIIK
jgi:acyl-CoA thioesterase